MAKGCVRTIARAVALLMSLPAFAQNSTFFTAGNLVVTVEGCGVHGGTCSSVPNGTGTGAGNSSVGGYGDNQGAPLTLFQYAPAGTSSVAFVNSLVLPQSASGANFAISGEYGSSSEGSVQLSGLGQYLTIMGYGINAATFDANPPKYGAAPSNALAQSGSLTGQSYTPVPRVLMLIDANGNVNSSTAIFNIFNTNNPRSAFTLTGSTAYVSGQGSGSDATGGVFYIPAVGATTTAPTAITGLDTSSKTIAQDTRIVKILNNTLYISVDSKEGSGNNRSFIGTLGSPPATSLYNSGGGPTMLTGYGNTGGTGKITINGNGNNLNASATINLSAENYFFASSSVLYVADSGAPKNDSNGDNNSAGTANIGDGGLQKWINTKSDGTGTWNLAYTLWNGLNLVNNGGTTGTSGLLGLAGTVSGNNVYLYATNYTLNDLDYTYLYGITDNITFTTATQAAGESFTLLDTAPSDSNFKGVSFVPTIPAGDVEVTSSPSGLAFTSSGTGCAPASYTTPLTLAWTPASNCTLSVTTPQSGGTGVQYVFSQWDDGTTNTSRVVTAPATTATYAATFTTQYQLTTAAGTGGSVSPGGYFAAGTNATVTATPGGGYCFLNFTGTTTSTVNPLMLLMSSPQSETANFAQGSGLYNPASGGTLTGSSATFNWCTVANATAYWLDIGSTQGGHDYYSSGSLSTSTLSQSVPSLPVDGSTVWARWYYLVSGSWQSIDYSYTAFGGSANRGAITSPTPSSNLTSSSVAFTWSAGSGATAYWIDAGSMAGGHDYYSSGNLGNVTSTNVSGLPTNGGTVYITLYSLVSGNWLTNAYTYTAYNLAAAGGVLTSPNPGSTLTSGTITFGWSAGSGSSAYWLDVGSTAGGHDYYSSGNLGNVLTLMVSGLPTDGSAVFVTLYSMIGSTWSGSAYTYTALNATSGLATIQSPSPNSALTGNTATFTWSSDANATAYWMDIGTASGGNTIYSSGNLGNTLTTTVYNLPANGSTIYVTLYSYVGGQWLSTPASYTSGP
jgi:Divergent InlB B-repeat domain